MSETVRDLLVRGIAAAKGKSNQEARFYLEWVTRAPDATHEQLTDAYRWLAQVVEDAQEKRAYLEHALAYNPNDPEARRAFALLNGELKPDEIIDPNKLAPPAASDSPLPAQARRFVCTQCGGKMNFSPDGNSLMCAYCGREQSLASALDDGSAIQEQDFVIALATAKGHLQPTMMRSIKCQGCGASFVLTPQTISKNCPYCASAYVIEQVEMRELIEPEAVVAFRITQAQALNIELDWFRKAGLNLRAQPAPPAGVYLPAWTFDVGGEVTWNCMVYRNKEWIPTAGSRAAYANDVIVPASRRLTKSLAEEIRRMPLDALAPYAPGYLADFPAETYEISVSDASLVARAEVYAREKNKVTFDILGQYQAVRTSSARLMIESYKLILVPMWVTHYRMDGKQYGIVINGHTGNLRADKPRAGIGGWLANLLGDV
jgi:DNA-directed RNA polymerase subunit RPC12/RpoP